MLGDEALPPDHPFAFQVSQDALPHRGHVDGRVPGKPDLDVEAHAIGVEDVVVPADPIKRVRRRVVRPVDVALSLLRRSRG
jgi:hypothetical protein